MNLDIIFENEDFLVLNKPAGILVHPTEREEKNTLVQALTKKYPEIKFVGEDLKRPGIVHRLDKDVSGLLVITKNQKSFYHLKKQFQDRKVKKIYLALVYGKIKPEKGVISYSIERKGGKMVAKKSQSGKEAYTEYELVKHYRDFSFLKITIETGRTHQIRAHLKVIGFPIVGDPLYKPKKKRRKEIDLKRPFLHSHKLGFYDRAGKWQEYQSTLPQDLNNFLKSQA